MNSLNILHISDAHIQMAAKEEVSEIVAKMINDALKVQKEQNIKIDLVCFTGDLIQRGDKAIDDEKQLELAEEILVNPVLSGLGLEKDKFIMVPGNHEIDVKKIVKATEKGLLVESLEEINDNVSDMNEVYLARLDYFYQWIDNYYDDIIREKIGYAFLREIDGKKIGIACIDSAWRSSGKGGCEKGIMYVGQKQINDLYKHIKDADIKICLMHHPTDWLSDYESTIIERELTKFDIVLRGHVHENDHKEVCRQSMKTIYSTAGKLFPLDYAFGRAVDGYNGYSILNIDFNNSICNIFLRTYYAKDRNDFDSAINLVENGQVSYPLNGDIAEKQMEFNIVNGINDYFTNMSETLTLIKEIDTYSPIAIEEVFVEPVLSEKSEYVSESSGKGENIGLDELLEDTNNVILLGKKESGKTTILQQIGLKYIDKYSELEIIPIHIDMRYLPKKSDKLTNAVIYFVMKNMFDDATIRKEKIKELIDSGKIVFLIDNIDISNANHTVLLSKFIKENSGNRFILTTKEEFFQSIDVKKLPEYTKDFKKLYINTFGKAQIRELVTKWAGRRDDVADVSEVVEKINGYCESINFAKTPFNVSIFMVLWDSDKNFVPQNEGIVMENYLEVLLEKLSPKEAERSTYSFKIKQHFLSNLAYKMFEKNEYYFSREEFNDFVYQYHKTKGYKEAESRFSALFFEKGILSISDDNIVFSHTSILEFYLAEYARNNEEFLNFMIQKGNRIYFKNEICFYSGLVPDCKKLLDSMADTIIEAIMKNIDVIDTLNNIEIITDFKIEKDELVKKLEENRPTQKEIDDMSDSSQKEVTPDEFRKKKSPILLETKQNSQDSENVEEEVAQQEAEDFYLLVSIYGSILKNAELLDNSDKVQHLENYMYAMNILLGEIFALAEVLKKEISFEDFIKENQEEGKELTQEDFEKSKELFLEMIKVSFPIALQHVILENVGTPKLEVAIDELMGQKEDKPFEKFMLEFLKCDLNVGNFMPELHRYIQKETSEGILKLIFIKLLFHYRMRFFGTDTQIYNSILDLIIEVQIKLNPEKSSTLSKAFKGNKSIVRKEVAKQIEQIEKSQSIEL